MEISQLLRLLQPQVTRPLAYKLMKFLKIRKAVQINLRSWKNFQFVFQSIFIVSCNLFPLVHYGFAALRGVATLKARVLKEVRNIATAIPAERGIGIGVVRNNNNDTYSGYGEGLVPDDNFLSVCNQELLARGGELLKRTRQGNLGSHYTHMHKLRDDELASN